MEWPGRLKARFGTAHLIAVAAGVTTAVLLLSWTRSQEQLVSVVFAASDVKAGTIVDATDLRVAEVPADSSLVPVIIPGAEATSLPGQVAVRAISTGEPILRSDVRPVLGEEGRRAMSFPVPASHAVGGGLAAGDRVDVLVVGEAGPSFVAVSVPVLAVPPEPSTGLAAGSSSWWVVLAVEDRDALEIADGVEHGTVYLLRSTGVPDLTTYELEASAEPEPPPEAGEGQGG